MYGYIYKFTNLVNNKCYVGKHKYNKPELDENYKASGILINQAFIKYGEDKFKHELICCCDTLEELNSKEIYFISKFNSMAPNGYNLTKGGDGISEPTPEIIEKNRIWHKGRKQSAESNKKRSETQKGKKHSEQWSLNISNALKGKSPHQNTIEASNQRHRNTHWYNDGVNEFMLFDEQASPNMIRGRLKSPFPNQTGLKKSKSTCDKISKNKINTCWYNNGEKEIMIKLDAQIPEGFVKGRIKKI